MAVNTAKVTDRRTLRYNSPDDLMKDVDALVAADRTGTLRRTGNWTLGQNLNHLACWSSYPYDGYPQGLAAPWIIKVLLKPFKNKYINQGLPSGKRIPGSPEGTYGCEPMPLDEGLSKFHAAWARLRKAPPAVPNVIFGPLTHDEWIALNLRHAELHLSFLHPA